MQNNLLVYVNLSTISLLAGAAVPYLNRIHEFLMIPTDNKCQLAGRGSEK